MANNLFSFFSKKPEVSPVTSLSQEMISFLQQYPLALLLLDATGRITFANPSAVRLLRLSEESLLTSYVDRFGLTMEKVRAMAQTNPPKKIILELVNEKSEVVFVGAAASVLAQTPFIMLTLESIPHFTQLTTDNTFLRSVLESVPSAIVVQNLAGTCLFWSRRAAELFGYPESAVVGQEIYPFFPKEIVQSLQRLDETILKERVSQEPVQLTCMNAQQKKCVFCVRKIFLPAENGKDLRILTVFEDITQRYHREQELLQNRTLLRAVLDNVPLGLYTRDCDNKVTFYNRQSLQVLNENNEDNVGRAHAYQTQQDVNMHKSREAAILREGKIKDFPEEFYTDSQGNKKILHLRKVPLKDAGPKPLVLSIVEDITDKLKQEKEIKRINTLLTAIVQNAPIGLYARTPDGRMLLRNQKCEELFGSINSKEMNQPHMALQHETPEQVSGYLAREQQVLETGEPLHIPEESYVDGKGATKLLRMIKVPVTKVENAENFVITLVEDITEMKAQEKELLETKNFLQTVLDNVPVAIYARGANDKIMFVNRRAYDMFPGEKEGEQVNRNDFYDKREKLIFEKGNIVDLPEEAYTTLDGRNVLLHLVKAPVFDKDGKPFMVLTVAEDITQKKAQEKEIIDTKNFLQNVINNLPVSLSVKDYEGKYILWNKKSEDLFGVSAKDVIGKTAYRSDMNKEQLEFVREGDLKVFDSKKEQNIPQELISTAQEGVKIMHTVKTPVFNEDGTPSSLIVVSEDITAKTRLEKQIREASDKNTLLVENAREGVLLIEDKKVMYANRALCNILGYADVKELTGKVLTDLTTPEDSELLRDKCEAVLVGSQTAEDSIVLHFLKQDGQVIEAEFSAVASRYLGRRILLCFMRDMTDLNRSQRELTRQREKYRQAFEQTPVPSFILQSNGYVREMNDSCRQLFGLQLSDKTFYRNVYLRPGFTLDVRRKLRNGEPAEMDYVFDFARMAQQFPDRVDAQQPPLPLHLIFSPIPFSGNQKDTGSPNYIVTVFAHGKLPHVTKQPAKAPVQLLRKPLPPTAVIPADAKDLLLLPNSEPYVVCTADFKMRSCNPLFCELCQLSEQELLGQQIHHLIDSDVKDQFEEDMKILVRTGMLSNRDYFINPASGLEKIAVRLTAIYDPSKDRYLFVMRNRTVHLQLVKVLEERTAQLNALLESTDGIVFTVLLQKGRFGAIDNVSQHLSNKLGYSQEELSRMQFKDLFVSKADRPLGPVLTQAQKELAKQGKTTFTRAVQCKEADPFEAQVTLSALDLPGQSAALVVLRDVSLEREAWGAASKEARELTSMRAALPGLYIKMKATGKVLEAYSNLEGLSSEKLREICQGKTPKQIWEKDAAERVALMIKEALAMNVVSHFELSWKLADKNRFFEASATPITGRDEVIVWLKDVTEGQNNEVQVRELYRLTGEPGLTITEQVDKILAFGLKALRADVGFVLRFAKAGRKWESHLLYVTKNDLQLEDATSFPVEECLLDVKDGSTRLWADLSAASCRNCVHIKKGLGMLVAAPLIVGGKVMGALCFASKTSRRNFEPGTEELMGVLARLLSLRIELRQTGKMLSESSRAFARTLSYVEKCAAMMDLDYQLTFINTPLLSYAGRRMDQLLGQNFFEELVRNANLSKRAFQDAAGEAEGNSFDIMLEILNKEGSYEEKYFNVVPCKDDNGSVASYALIETE